MFVTAELLADAPGVRRSHEEEPFQIPGTPRVLFFLFKKNDRCNKKGGGMSAALGENLCQEGFIVID
jgi:hypothetical protein